MFPFSDKHAATAVSQEQRSTRVGSIHGLGSVGLGLVIQLLLSITLGLTDIRSRLSTKWKQSS